MELWDDDLDCRALEVSPGKRDEILLLVDSGYSRRAISCQTGTAVDLIEYLVANRMSESHSSSDDDSDPDIDMLEQEPDVIPSNCDINTGTDNDRSAQATDRNELVVTDVSEIQKSKETIQDVGLHRPSLAGVYILNGNTKLMPQQEETVTEMPGDVNQRQIATRADLQRCKVNSVLESAGKLNDRKSMPEHNDAIVRLYGEGVNKKEIAKRLRVSRSTVNTVLTLAGMPRMPSRLASGRAQQKETAVLKLFEEGVSADKISKQVKLDRRTVANILLFHGKSFALRKPGTEAPVRATEEDTGAIRALVERGCSKVQTALQLGIQKALVMREIYLAQRTERMTDNACDKANALPAAKEQRENATPSSSTGSHADQPKKKTRRRTTSPENPEPVMSTSVSFTLSDEFLSDSADDAAIHVFREVVMDSNSDCFPNIQEKFESDDPNTSVRCSEPILSRGNECCDLVGVSSGVTDDDCHMEPSENVADAPAKETAAIPSGRRYRCDLCLFDTYFEAVFLSHLLGTKHALLAAEGVVLRCISCPFRTRQPQKMVGHAVTHQFHCLSDQADVYSIVSSS